MHAFPPQDAAGPRGHAATPVWCAARSLWPALAVVVMFVVAAVYAFKLYAPCDDTYIYLVYVKNLLHGHGLTFNGTKVQGFTSPLWVALISLGGFLRAPLPQVAERLSLSAGLFVMFAAYRLGRRAGLSPLQAMVVPGLLAATGDFAFYMSNGLETVLFMGMVLLSLEALFDGDPAARLRSRSLPAVLALTMLARPEGALIAAVVLAHLGRRAGRDAALRCAIATAAPVVLWGVIAFLYYGSFLPNTFYAKSLAGFSNLGQGAVYIGGFLKSQAPVAALIAYTAAFRRHLLGAGGRTLLALALGYILYVLVQGGDNMVGHRALLPVVPVMYLVLAIAFSKLRKPVVLLAGMAICAYHYGIYNHGTVVGGSWQLPVREHADIWRQTFDVRRDTARYLKTQFPPGTLVALNAAGIIPYFSEQPTIDMLGLNDPRIARRGHRDRSLAYGHQVGDGAYVLGRRPKVILFGGLGRTTTIYFVSDREIWNNLEFRRGYRPRMIAHDVRMYVRADSPKRRR